MELPLTALSFAPFDEDLVCESEPFRAALTRFSLTKASNSASEMARPPEAEAVDEPCVNDPALSGIDVVWCKDCEDCDA